MHCCALVAAALLAAATSLHAQPGGKFTEVQEYLFDLPDLPAGLAAPAMLPRLATASDYPLAALRARQSGVVAVKFRVQEDGSTADAEIVASSGVQALDQAALELIDERGKYPPREGGAQQAVGTG